MPTAYLTRATSIHANERNEVKWSNIKPAGMTYTSTSSWVGVGSDTIAENHLGSAIIFDASQIPRDAQVVRSAVYVEPSATDTTAFNIEVWYFAAGSTGVVDSYDEIIITEQKLMARFRDGADTEIAREGAVVTGNTFYAYNLGVRGLGQVVLLDSTGDGTLAKASMWLTKIGTLLGTVELRLWSVAGSSGAYRKGELLTISDTRPADDVNGTELEFTFSNPRTIAAGERYIIEVVFSDNPADNGAFAYAAEDTGFSSPSENALASGVRMDGFGNAAYPHGRECQAGKGFLLGGAEYAAPWYVAGVQTSFGAASYSPNVTFAALDGYVQAMLDARDGSGRIGLVFETGSGASANEEKEWHSSYSATPTVVDGTSYFGPVLKVEYTVPGKTRAFPSRARPAVAHGVPSSRPAVSSPAEPRARSAVRAAEEPRGRSAINRGEARARPAVRHYPAGPRST